ncbi:MAG: hypothetical protein ABSC94_01120 [Polyangiaceae bacterium]
MNAPTVRTRPAAPLGAGDGRAGETARSVEVLDVGLMALCALVTCGLSAQHIPRIADAAHDGGVRRAIAFEAEVWRWLDAWIGLVFGRLPAGTPATRATLGGIGLAAGAAAVVYAMTRTLLGACAETRRLRFVVAAVATLTVFAGVPWQTESASVGGSVSGALLGLSCLFFADRASRDGRPVWFRATLIALVFASLHEPLVGACALVGCFALFASSPEARRHGSMGRQRGAQGAGDLGVAALAGFAPWVIALLRVRWAGGPLGASAADGWAGERGASTIGSPVAFLGDEVGLVLVVLGLAGTVLAWTVPRARSLATGLFAMALSGLAMSWIGAPVGPTRYGAPILSALAAWGALAGVALQAAVRAVLTARLPYAQASGVMVLTLECALPVGTGDEMLLRLERRSAEAESAMRAWNDLAFGTLPPRSVLVLSDPDPFSRALAARAQGVLRGDVILVPAFPGRSPLAKDMAVDPALIPLWRDLAMRGMPDEASLSSLAATRPVITLYEPRWGTAIARHLLPLALFDRFEPEPRGATDRRKALDDFARERDDLATRTRHDPELSTTTRRLLEARALAMPALGDRALAERAQADARAFAR